MSRRALCPGGEFGGAEHSRGAPCGWTVRYSGASEVTADDSHHINALIDVLEPPLELPAN